MEIWSSCNVQENVSGVLNIRLSLRALWRCSVSVTLRNECLRASVSFLWNGMMA